MSSGHDNSFGQTVSASVIRGHGCRGMENRDPCWTAGSAAVLTCYKATGFCNHLVADGHMYRGSLNRQPRQPTDSRKLEGATGLSNTKPTPLPPSKPGHPRYKSTRQSGIPFCKAIWLDGAEAKVLACIH